MRQLLEVAGVVFEIEANVVASLDQMVGVSVEFQLDMVVVSLD